MDLTEYLKVVRKYWVSVLAFLVGGVVLAGAATLLAKPTYTASTAVFLTVQTGGTAGELQQGSTYAGNQVKSFAQVVTMPVVLEPVIQRFGLPVTPGQLAERVTASVPTGTALIEISVVGTDPELTAQVTNAIGDQVIQAVGTLSPRGARGEQSVIATVVSPAAVPTQWTSPRVLVNLLLGAVVGLALGVGQSVLRSRLDTRVINGDDVEEVTDRSIVGTILFDPDAEAHPLIFQTDPHSLRAEAYRRLRTNLQFLEIGDRPKSIVVTSSVSGEGKSTTAINAAFTLADAGQSVLLIDADLRRPKVAGYLNLPGSVGLTTAIIGQATLDDGMQPLGVGNLQVLAAGEVPPNPSELLGSRAMKRILAEATSRFDMVIIDAPPLLPVTDAAVLSRITGGVLVVVGSETVAKPELAAALDSLEAVDANVLGLVLNRVRSEHIGHYGYSYYRHEAPEVVTAPPKPGTERRDPVRSAQQALGLTRTRRSSR